MIPGIWDHFCDRVAGHPVKPVHTICPLSRGLFFYSFVICDRDHKLSTMQKPCQGQRWHTLCISPLSHGCIANTMPRVRLAQILQGFFSLYTVTGITWHIGNPCAMVGGFVPNDLQRRGYIVYGYDRIASTIYPILLGTWWSVYCIGYMIKTKKGIYWTVYPQ